MAEAQPDWAMEEQFWVNKLMPALKVNSFITSLPTKNKHRHTRANSGFNKLMPALRVTTDKHTGKRETQNTHKYVIKTIHIKIILIKITLIKIILIKIILIKTILIKITIMKVLFFKLDSLASSHPVSMPVQDPKEIEAIFDTISYKKVVIN